MSADTTTTERLHNPEDSSQEDIGNIEISAHLGTGCEERVDEQLDDEEEQILEYIRKQSLIQRRLRRLNRLPSSRLHSSKLNRCRPRTLR